MNKFWIVKGFKILLIMALFLLVMGTIVMTLWNWLMPSLFNLPTLDLVHAIGLLALSRLLTGGFRMGVMGSKEHWEYKKQMWEKWSKMPPEERQRWKDDWRERCHSRRMMGFKRHEEEGTGEI
jgi:Ca2+/H+ antiporter, TMEM165/GDT1 family